MKANELMIGDWVFLKNGKVLQPCKVTVIGNATNNRNEIGISVCLDTSDEFPTCIFEIDEISPIPLTPEILEKNGFEKALHVSDTEPFDIDEEGNKHYSYNKTFWGWLQTDNIFCIPANGMGWLYIKYVHELQHILRLCGIEKEIEL